jgi:hypothetical protein
MADTTITVTLDEATAEIYNMASPETQAKMQMLMQLLLREYATSTKLSLRELMDIIGDEAERKGMTPETLEQLLQDDE